MALLRKTLPGRRDLLAPAAAFPGRYGCLLQSVLHGTAQARYDLLFLLEGESVWQDAAGQLHDRDGALAGRDFLAELDRRWAATRRPAVDDELPFHGGWVVFLAYELAGQIEPSLRLTPSPRLPLAQAWRSPAAIIVDHQQEQTLLLAEPGREDLLARLEQDLQVTAPIAALPPARLEEDPPEAFLRGVERVHQHLLDGDIFQVNLSRAWHARFVQAPAAASLYQALRQANPAPFAALLQQPGWAIVSSSPERLVSAHGGVAQTRPIAGTRPRLPGEDEADRIAELTGHPKERAEHVMLIDLERNDLGRVCQPGTVEVDELMVVESYAHVHHIVSNVRGRLRPEVTPGQLIAATFPGGTITGCPKVRCMEIIAALEQAPRGAYTGAVGYLDHHGQMDLNILIRTLTLCGDQAELRAGAGIVADSVAEKELEETRAKARGLLRALTVPA